jgi:hypothetical protein
VHELPEGWRAPAIIQMLTQIAQIGPMLFLLFRWLFPRHVGYTIGIYVSLAVGFLACVLLAFLWRRTAFIFGEERSVALFALSFALSLLGILKVSFFLFFFFVFFHIKFIFKSIID